MLKTLAVKNIKKEGAAWLCKVEKTLFLQCLYENKCHFNVDICCN